MFSWPVRVYWEDTDAGGFVFYANYLRFFERARTEWLRSLGIGQQQLKASTGGMFVVAQTSVRYLRPARLDDELIVTASLQQSGRASMTIEQQVLKKNTLLCEGSIRIGWVDASSMQAARIPLTIIESLRVKP
jgi:acyl-CoA thioester hydrolase